MEKHLFSICWIESRQQWKVFVRIACWAFLCKPLHQSKPKPLLLMDVYRGNRALVNEINWRYHPSFALQLRSWVTVSKPALRTSAALFIRKMGILHTLRKKLGELEIDSTVKCCRKRSMVIKGLIIIMPVIIIISLVRKHTSSCWNKRN